MRAKKLLTRVLAAMPLALPAGSGAETHAAEASWLARAQQQIAQREYEASQSERGLQAPNRAQSFRTVFTPAGITIHQRDAAAAEVVALKLAGIGRATRREPVSPGVVTSEGSRVEIARPGVVEWYENSPDGLEQGFTLASWPEGVGELVLELDVRGAHAAQRGDAIVLSATATGRRLEYGKLAVQDATGRALPSRLALSPAGQIAIAVEDAGATYPVVIDPLLVNGADTQLSPTQTHSQFGYSVAGAGDVNGDGYDDVIVGAPSYDAGQDNEGVAFVFLGSSSGIANGDPTSAARRLGAGIREGSVGASVAGAGDVNADGVADVIVGAPVQSTLQNENDQTGRAWVVLPEPGSTSTASLASAGLLLAALARRGRLTARGRVGNAPCR